MNKIIAVASAKGGVGKSTISCHLGKMFAENNEKTIVVETDSGLRGLDISLNANNIVFDCYDILTGNCKIDSAVQTINPNLMLLPAPFSHKNKLNKQNIETICYELENNYKKIIFDLTAGYTMTSEILEIADLILVVVTPDIICVRDSSIFVNFLKTSTKKNITMKLIVNKLQKHYTNKKFFKNLDDIIDETSLQLIGVIPASKAIEIATMCGEDLKKRSLNYRIFNAIARRINGKEANLLV